MPRPEKVQAVADIKERLDGAQAVFLTEYSGLSVKEQQQLRRDLKANGAEMKVVKMTLARLATEGMTDELTELLLGPTALTYADGDPAGAAKALASFAKDHDVLIIKGGLLGSEFLSPERISVLAALPSRDVMLGTIAATMAAPMTQMAGLLAALPRNAANAFKQLLEQKEAEAPAEPEPEQEVAPESMPDTSTTEDAVTSEALAEEATDMDEAPAEEAKGAATQEAPEPEVEADIEDSTEPEEDAADEATEQE